MLFCFHKIGFRWQALGFDTLLHRGRKRYVLKRPLFEKRNNHCFFLLLVHVLFTVGVHTDILTDGNKMSPPSSILFFFNLQSKPDCMHIFIRCKKLQEAKPNSRYSFRLHVWHIAFWISCHV